MALFITHSARAVKSVLQRPAARAMRSYLLVRVSRAAAPPHASQHGRASIPRYLWMLTAGQQGAFCTSAVPGAAAVVTQPIVLVKIGVDGNDRSLSLTYDALIRMDAAVLLRSLKVDEAFSADLKDVPLGKCTVWLLPRVAGKKPTNEEEAAAVELRAAATIGDLLTAQKWTPTRLLFLRVRMPPTASSSTDVSAGSVSESSLYRASATWDECVAAMSDEWRTVATDLRTARAVFSPAAVPMLHLSSASVNASRATALKLDVLHVDPSTQQVQLGLFTLPALPSSISSAPKGFVLAKDEQFFLQEQRMQLTHEFVDAMVKERDLPYGVLLSGPNGVGKSAVGVQTFMTCFARSMLVVYIPSASMWVHAAEKAHGDRFFIERLLRQNADLIAALPTLRHALAPVLQGRHEYSACMDALMQCMMKNMHPQSIGVIVDEVQRITAVESAPAAKYFAMWKVWDSNAQFFVRMDIASSHGVRELRLPSGEEHRLRFILPWPSAVVESATQAPSSPLALDSMYDSERKRIIFSAGGIPRSLFWGRDLLLTKLKKQLSPERAIAAVEHQLREAMAECCRKWFMTLEPIDQVDAVRSSLPLLRGQLSWARVKALYDDGLVALSSEDMTVSPVSPVAASVIALETARHSAGVFKPLKDEKAGDARGIALKRQVVACLIRERSHSLDALSLDCSATYKVQVSTDDLFIFKHLSQVVCDPAQEKVYIPHSAQFPCDAISVPAANSPAAEPIVVWETSVTDPRESERVDKCLRWFRTDSSNGIIQPLQRNKRPIVCALCWPEAYTATKHIKFKELDAEAARVSTAASPVRFVVVDMQGLLTLGVLV